MVRQIKYSYYSDHHDSSILCMSNMNAIIFSAHIFLFIQLVGDQFINIIKE